MIIIGGRYPVLEMQGHLLLIGICFVAVIGEISRRKVCLTWDMRLSVLLLKQVSLISYTMLSGDERMNGQI